MVGKMLLDPRALFLGVLCLACAERYQALHACAERYQAPVSDTQSAAMLLAVASPILTIVLVAPQPIGVKFISP